VDISTFWDIIETARARSGPGEPFDQALAGYLATRSRQDILEYQERFDDVHAALYRRDVWAAAYLIGGGCSDDGFTDFRAGLIAQGHAWYQQVAASPDSLAGHPAVTASAPDPSQDEPLFDEAVSYAAAEAFERLTGGDDDFYDALDHHQDARQHSDHDPAGKDFDFNDDNQMRRHLPQLAALYLPSSSACSGPVTPSPPSDPDRLLTATRDRRSAANRDASGETSLAPVTHKLRGRRRISAPASKRTWDLPGGWRR